MPGVELGYEAPTTVHNCQIGRDVQLKGGFYYSSTFLEKSSMGSGAQVRESCLLEEGARGAHNVGLKHTILFPFVTLGSLINFCDCLMAGGTDEKNHSEVGSSYIHFNYTPDQDKITASLIGDVPRGVMINQSPIFLGGQGGAVGPVRIEYGTIVAAGTIVRKDILKQNSMLLGNSNITRSIPFRANIYSNLSRIIKLNTIYISNLMALRRYYLDIRSLFISNDIMEGELHKGAVDKIESAIKERIKHLEKLAKKMPRSIEIEKNKSKSSEKAVLKKKEFFERWQDIKGTFNNCINEPGDITEKEMFSEFIEKSITRKGKEYVMVIKDLKDEESLAGITWLQGLVDSINGKIWALLPNMRIKE
jgi:UDP-N-acetylglucosamine/UDP-N-acetylgalactosamine diphosphorylase